MVARAAAQQRRLEDRERLSLSRRLTDCEHRIALRSTVQAKAYDRDTIAQGYESTPPPDAFADQDPQDLGMAPIDHLVQPIRNAIQDLEQALDFDDGHTLVRATSTLLSHEKDHELQTRWKGVAAATVARYAPHLGSQRTIERARSRLGVQPGSGLPLVLRDAA